MKKCFGCGKEMNKPYKFSKKQWKETRFCSHKCHGKTMERKKITFECQFCYKTVTKKTRNDWKNKFCGKQCAGKAAVKIATDVRDFNRENNPSWKGGVCSKNKLGRTSKNYLLWKDLVFKRDDYTCQICGVKNEYFHADHIEKYSKSEEKRYLINNGRTLCRKCHFKITFGKEMPLKSRWGIKYA